MKKFFTLSFALMTLVAVSSCGHKTSDRKADNKILTVSVVTPMTDKAEVITTSGRVQSDDIARLGTRIMGYVQKVAVQKGQKVRKGQILVKISDQEIQAKKAQAQSMVAQAKAAYDVAKADEARFARLLDKGSCSKKEYENVKLNYDAMAANLKVAHQMVREAQAHQAYTQIKAPFAGLVTDVQADQGSLAHPGMPLVTVEKAGAMVVQTQVGESAITQLEVDSMAVVEAPSANLRFKAKIAEHSTSSVATGGQYQVTLAVPAEIQKSLLSGMHVDVQLPLRKDAIKVVAKQGVWLPINVLVHQGDLTGVYVVTGDKQALLKWVRLGRTQGQQVEVLSGVSPKDHIIIPAGQRLYNGVKVTIQ